MNEFSSDTNWGSLLILGAYGILILLYFMTLKALLNCLERMLQKSHHPHKSVIDLDIRQEEANKHIDDKSHTVDAYKIAMGILKAFFAVAGVTALYVILMLKTNVFIATGVAVLIGIIIWQFILWRNNRGKKLVERYENFFIEIGGYNIGTLIFLGMAFILISACIILLP